MKKLIIVVAIVIVLLILIIGIWFVGTMAEPAPIPVPTPAPTAAPVPMSVPTPALPAPTPTPKIAPKPAIKPRPDPIIDCGYQTGRRGWYDAQNQGARNDYCRYVGDAPGIWFSCHLAGATSNTTPSGFVIDPNSPHDEHDGTRGCPAGGAYDTLM